MSAKKIIEGTKTYELIATGNYEIGYRKDSGEWNVITELTVVVPSDRKAYLTISVGGEEVDV